MTFDEYLTAFAKEFEQAQERLAKETQLAHLEKLALKIAFLFHSGTVKLPAGAAGQTVASLVAMLTNEVFAFSGAMRAGALHAAWHHVRAVLEIEASLHYLFDDPSKTPQRVEQFVEFASMLPWIKRRTLEVAVQKGEMTQDEFDRKNLVSDALIEHATPTKVAAWVALFGVKNEDKLLRRRRWHDGTIEDLFRSKDPSGRAFTTYETMCHATHVSPVGHRLSSPSAPRLLGFDPGPAANAIEGMFGYVYVVLEKLNAVMNSELDEHLAPEVDAFVNARFPNGNPNAE